MSLIELALAVHERLDESGFPHAFGGALALAYVAEPRGTVDIDVNVFTPIREVDDVLAALAVIGLRAEADPADFLPAAGIRLTGEAEPFPVDVFPSLDDAYDEIAARVVDHPFGPDRRQLPFLSPEDLVLFKLSFGRAKDWVDISAVAVAVPHLDIEYVERQLLTLRGPSMHPRVARLRALLRAAADP